MTLVDNWKQAWRWYSTHALILATSVPLAMAEAEKYFGQEFPMWVKVTVAGVIFVSGVIGRVILQEKSDVVDTQRDN
ncbi:hypothetical protein NH672_19045 [Klebsiella pneumoniae]|uniref:DUF7940 domain-containing protein n=1 Tax=Klebsiella/Raoultella group TaxID=2890311 RepID=UPI000DE677A8|nr:MULTISPECIES: hypothetical protein [Klebsiella/Raoultella group]HBM7350574.1 hypothetical protein [Klebsiella oxytoca]EIW1121537.1 hypothetical protein [Klebsiella pneumoniae]MBD8367608.1 hypothetical protein [Klebsiella pneumoniae]MCO7329159.1 hypothetical protein [Klebsiella pneumoniae]MDT1804265.1 hypothetical protein [Klebsiella pneumoniae]